MPLLNLPNRPFMGVTHIPSPEEWPLMPVHRAGFKLVPAGFFARNPAMKGAKAK
jgi:Cu2+-containing amine oxidase